MSAKDRPEVSIDAIKELVKKLKAKGIGEFTRHDAALALSTVGFKEVCAYFGTTWNDKQEKTALEMLINSYYELNWYGHVNNVNYVPLLQLCQRGDIEKVKEFIRSVDKAKRADMIATTDNLKRTALHLVIKYGFDVLAEYLINYKFSVHARDRELKTPLHHCHNYLTCQLLLKKGAVVVAKDNKYCTPVHYAAAGNDHKILDAMLKKANVVNELDASRKTPLFYAVYNASEEQIAVLRVLVENGANINMQDSFGKTALHYAAEMGKYRCIPFLLQKGASIDVTDSNHKTALDLAANYKTRKIMTAYYDSKGIVLGEEEKQKRKELTKIVYENTKDKYHSQSNKPKIGTQSTTNAQIYTKELNQVSTWVREKFFVLMKKLQESGVKALWHIKRPYIYTGSWAEDIDGLEDLYETFLNINGPEAAMRTFNILCPYEKALPTVLGKSEEAFQSFFGENWFSNDPVYKIRNLHSQSKIRNELYAKAKYAYDLKTELLGYRAYIEKLYQQLSAQKDVMRHYENIEYELRKERTKNTQQYNVHLKQLTYIASLKEQIYLFANGEENTKMLSAMVEELRSKNTDLLEEINYVKINEAAARRKCGKLFLKALSMSAKDGFSSEYANLYDDDSIISLYDLLASKLPNLYKRFKHNDRKGTGKLSIDYFTKMLYDLQMLPQDVMSMHRIVGFAFGRKTLSYEYFKTILESRHKNRPMWEKELVRKIKTIILKLNTSIDTFFAMVDSDMSGAISPAELRKGLENYNVFLTQTDWSNLFSLLDADKSGEIDLKELKTLLLLEKTGKLEKQQLPEGDEEEKGYYEKEQYKKKYYEKEEEEGEDESKKKYYDYIYDKQSEKEPKNNYYYYEYNYSKHESNRSIKSENKLLDNEQYFSQEYYEKDSEYEHLLKLNGDIKVQVPLLQLPEGVTDKVYIKFAVADFEMVKMADLKLSKLAIALKFEMIEYKLVAADDLKMFVSVYKTREFDEENYLGEVEIAMYAIIDQPNTWAVNTRFDLVAGEYQKDVEGALVLQAKWIPKADESG